MERQASMAVAQLRIVSSKGYANESRARRRKSRADERSAIRRMKREHAADSAALSALRLFIR